MRLEEPAGKVDGKVAADTIGLPLTFIPALVCAGLSVVFVRTGLLALFFLVPLGFCGVVFGSAAAWLCVVFATFGNGALLAAAALYRGAGLADIGLSVLYFTVVALGFTWIMAGNPPESRWMPATPRVRTLFRFTAASVAGALAFMGMTFLQGGEDALRAQVEAISSSYIAAAGTDAAQRAFLEQTLTADRIIGAIYAVILHGGALVSAFFLFFYSRLAAFALARLFHRQGGNVSGDLIGFHAPRRAIWVLSLCLPVILLSRIAALGAIEIAAWNLLVICATMFFAQGSGIVLFRLTRGDRPMPMLARMICIALLVCALFSPGINVLALGLLILLGIAENWLPLRAVNIKRETTF